MQQTANSIEQSTDRADTAKWCAALLLLTLLAYGNVIANGSFIWDDPEHVVNNEQLRSFDGLIRIWTEPTSIPQYYPLVHTTFWCEYQLWELQPNGYHAVNVLLHGLNAVLLWLILRRLKLRGALFAAFLFALHPVHVESVAWITERKNILSGLFYLLATLSYLRFRFPIDPSDAENSDRRVSLRNDYIRCVLFFVLALLSKTVTASWPAAMLIVVWWKQGRLTKSDWLPLLPFFAIGLGAGWMTSHLESTHVGASGADWDFSVEQRCVIAGRSVWFYAGKLFWPYPLIFNYERWDIEQLGWTYLYPILAIVFVVALFAMRKRLSRGPIAAALFFGGTLVPALGFINVYPMLYYFAADHFQYLASIGMLVLAAEGFAKWINERKRTAFQCSVLVVFVVLSWQQQAAYRDTESLWRDTIRKNPTAWMAHYNLGNELLERGEFATACEHYEKVINIRPQDSSSLNNWAKALQELGQLDQAFEKYRQAIAVKNDAEYFYNLGNLEMRLNRLADARETYRQAVERQSDFTAAWSNLGVAEFQLAQQNNGDFGRAYEYFATAVKLVPQHQAANSGAAASAIAVGNQLLSDEKMLAARDRFQQALRHRPKSTEAAIGLATVELKSDSLPVTENLLRRVIAARPTNAVAYDLLGQVFLRQKKINLAVQAFTTALKFAPNNTEYRARLDEAKLRVWR